jgi:hypothetical protein
VIPAVVRVRIEKGIGGMDVADRRPEMDRREVALELVKLAANTGFINPGDKPDFTVLLKAYSKAFEAVIESEHTPMLKR